MCPPDPVKSPVSEDEKKKKKREKRKRKLIYSENELLLPAGQKKPRRIENDVPRPDSTQKKPQIFGSTEKSENLSNATPITKKNYSPSFTLQSIKSRVFRSMRRLGSGIVLWIIRGSGVSRIHWSGCSSITTTLRCFVWRGHGHRSVVPARTFLHHHRADREATRDNEQDTN